MGRYNAQHGHQSGQREFDMVKRFATHDYDQVLGLYYAKARFYSARDRRFMAIDPILDPSQYDIQTYVENPMQLIQYLYANDNPLTNIDRLGLFTEGDQLSINGIYSQRNTAEYDIVELRKALNKSGVYGLDNEKEPEHFFFNYQVSGSTVIFIWR